MNAHDFFDPPEIPLTTLPDEPCTLVLAADAKFDGDDWRRFEDLGGRIKPNGYRLFITPSKTNPGSGVTITARSFDFTGKVYASGGALIIGGGGGRGQAMIMGNKPKP